MKDSVIQVEEHTGNEKTEKNCRCAVSLQPAVHTCACACSFTDAFLHVYLSAAAASQPPIAAGLWGFYESSFCVSVLSHLQSTPYIDKHVVWPSHAKQIKDHFCSLITFLTCSHESTNTLNQTFAFFFVSPITNLKIILHP